MAQVNAAENVITHERTIYLDNAADLKIYNWAGWYFRVLKTSSALVEITARIDNEGTEAKTLQLGAGWRHRYFEKLALSWAAQPGESITIEFGGNPLTYRPGEYESYVPNSVSAVEVSNTLAQAVPVNDAALIATFNALLVTLATTALVVKVDPTPFDVDLELPAGSTIVEALSAAIGATATTILTVTAGKNFVARQIMGIGNVFNSFGQVWVEDGSSNIIWRRGIVPGGNGHITEPLLLKPGYLIRGKCTYGSIRYQIHGYEYTP